MENEKIDIECLDKKFHPTISEYFDKNPFMLVKEFYYYGQIYLPDYYM